MLKTKARKQNLKLRHMLKWLKKTKKRVSLKFLVEEQDAPPRKPKELKDKKEKKFNLKTGGKGTAKERLEEIQKEKLAAKLESSNR